MDLKLSDFFTDETDKTGNVQCSSNKTVSNIKKLTVKLLYDVLFDNKLSDNTNLKKLSKLIVNELNINEKETLSLSTLDSENISSEISDIVRNKVTKLFDNNIHTDLTTQNIIDMDSFLDKNLENITCISDLKGRFLKVNDKFSTYTGFSNQEIYKQYIQDYIIKWEYIEHIDHLDNNTMKGRNVYKTKNNKSFVKIDWVGKEINNCYYSIGKCVEIIKNNQTNIPKFVKLNKDMTVILETYRNKKKLSSVLAITIYRLDKIINSKELYNDFYYIKYNDCPLDLIKQLE